MTDQTAIQKVAPYNRFRDLVKSENVQERFQQLLASRAPEFLGSLLSLVSADKNLLECDPATIFAAAAKAAILHLPIAKELGYAWIIPFKREATFVIGYKGLIQLAIRTSQYQAINATEIWEGEEVVLDRLTGNVKLNGRRAGDDVTGYVAYFRMKNGFEKYLYMSKEEVTAHAKRFSKSFNFDNSAWKTDFDAMGKKTVLRLLLGKYGLLSIEMQDADQTENAPMASDDPRLAMPTFDDLDIIEGEASEVQEEEPEVTSTNGKVSEAEIIAAAIEDKSTENEHSAKATLKLLKMQFQTVDEGRAAFKLYRAWRDSGMAGDAKQAAELTRNGEVPK